MIKHILILASAVAVLASCNNANTESNGHDHDHDHDHAHMTTDTVAGRLDPVCNMVDNKNTWTIYSVIENDSTFFCSPVCKERFDKNPAEFVKK